MRNVLIVTMIAAAVPLATAHAQDATAGEQVFKRCLPCHAVGEGAKNKVGPILNGLDGRHSGAVSGYSYSEANTKSGITWTKDQFLDYIRDPRAKIPGTRMVFAGIKKEQEANDLWAYLAQFDAEGKKK